MGSLVRSKRSNKRLDYEAHSLSPLYRTELNEVHTFVVIDDKSFFKQTQLKASFFLYFDTDYLYVLSLLGF